MKRLALAAVLVVLQRPEAHACTCAPDGYRAWPADGATNVPINAAIVVAHGASEPAIVLRRGTTNVTLVLEPHGSAWLNGRYVIARAPRLEPATTYELAITVFDERTVTTFTTGTAEDTTPPSVALRSFEPETMPYPIRGEDGNYCYDSCVEADGDRVSRARIDVEADADAVLVALAIGDDTIALSDRGAQTIGFHSCGTRSPSFVSDQLYGARALAFDQAGNIATSAVVTTAARGCVAQLHPTELCAPADDCLAEPTPPSPPDAPMPAPPTSGCSTSRDPAGLLLLLAFVLARRVCI